MEKEQKGREFGKDCGNDPGIDLKSFIDRLTPISCMSTSPSVISRKIAPKYEKATAQRLRVGIDAKSFFNVNSPPIVP